MPDLEYLRSHYAMLSDEELLSIDRGDLVEAAQKCYDEEMSRRKLATAEDPSDEAPNWLEDAAEVYSESDRPGSAPAPRVAAAHDVLKAAGIPCSIEFSEYPAEVPSKVPETHKWQVMVPGKLSLHAMSVLDRDMFNDDFETTWKTHLEMLSDDELRAMDPKDVFCGLFDQIERINRTYREELSRRTANSSPASER